MGAGDLVALVRTGRALGILQQFTTDKRVLHAAIDAMHYQPLSYPSIDPSRPAESRFGLDSFDAGESSTAGLVPKGLREDQVESPLGAARLHRERVLDETLRGLRFVVDGLRDLPGRKSLVLFSEGMGFPDERHEYRGIESPDLTTVRELTDAAGRASVVIYGIDPRGAHLRTSLARPLGDMSILTDGTGGAVFLQNDLSVALARMLDEQQGYYLIGYEPDASAFDRGAQGPVFRKLEVRVKRPGLRVKSRRGFVGVPDTNVSRSEYEALIAATVSPFPERALPVHLAALFGAGAGEAGRYVVRSLVHVDGSTLKFTPDDDGERLTLHLSAFVIDANGVPRGERQREVRLPVSAAQIAALRQAGLVMTFDIPIERPGGYQVRVAVRDAASGRLGSASQFVAVPDLQQRQLALSDIAIGDSATGATRREIDVSAPSPDNSPVLRRFRPGSRVAYGFAVYNATRDARRGERPLALAWRLMRDGEVVLDGTPSSIVPAATDARTIAVGGSLRLPDALPPGEYALETTVTDPLARASARTARREVALSVVP
jgi:VWFA-related protein